MTYVDGGPPVSGTVTTTDDSPVPNATVTALGVNVEKLDVNPARVEEKAQELLQRAKNVSLPENFTRDPTELRSRLSEPDSNVAIAHTARDWTLSPGLDSPDLSTPAAVVEPGTSVVLSVRDPTQNPFIQDTVDEDLPGIVVDDTNITVEQLGPSGGVKSTTTYETGTGDDVFEVGAGPLSGTGGTHEFIETTLSRGLYRYYPEGNPATAQYLVVTSGDPSNLFSGFVTDLKDQKGNLMERAQYLRDKLDSGTFEKTTFTTDANGTFSPSFPSNVKTVAYSAYKGPLDRLAKDPQNVTISDLRGLYETGFNGSVYLSEGTVRASASENVSLIVREFSSPSFINNSRFSDFMERFEERLMNESFVDQLPGMTQPPALAPPGETAEQTADRLRAIYGNLSDVIRASDPLRESYLALSNRSEVPAAENLTRSDLHTEIGLIRAATRTSAPELDVESPDVSTSENALSAEWVLPRELDELDYSLLVRYANGTTTPIPEQYVETESRPLRSDILRVSEFPLGETDPASASLVLDVAGAEGFGSATTSVTNPSYSGTIPSLNSISLSSLQPAAGDEVTMDITPENRNEYGNVTSVTVVATESNTTVKATHVDSDTVRFTPTEAGSWTAVATIETPDGTSFQVRVPFEVRSVDKNRPPSIRALSSPLGNYALVGDGINAGDVEIQSGGTDIDIAAQIGSGADAPGEMQVYAHGLDMAPSHTLDVRVVRGEQQTSVNSGFIMTVHQPTVPEGGTLFVEGSAVGRNEKATVAETNTSGSQTVITAASADDATVSIETNAAPSWWDSLMHSLGFDGLLVLQPPILPIPFLGDGGASGAILAGAAGVAATRRRSAT